MMTLGEGQDLRPNEGAPSSVKTGPLSDSLVGQHVIEDCAGLDEEAHIGLSRHIAPVDPLDRLFRPQRDQHADDDSADLLGELMPATPRPGFVDLHVAPRTNALDSDV
jgi:hypothetical protein